MHELGIVFHIISSLEQVGAQNHLRSISTVTLEIGEVSSVINSYLEDCWRWAADRSELLRGAALRIETIPAVTLCEGCGKTYGTVELGKTCTYCAGIITHLLTGNEVNIKEIEAC